ncbi:MAG: hypothetical protein ACREOO_14730 [bacterium]
MKMLTRWQQGILQTWIKVLPDQTLEKRPDLCLWYAISFLQNANYDACEPYLQRAEQAWLSAPVDHKLYAVWTARAIVAFVRADAAASLAAGQKAVAMATDPENPLQQAMSRFGLAFGYLLNGRYQEAETSFGEALAFSEKIGHHIIYFASSMWSSFIQSTQGRLREALGTLQRAEQRGSLHIPVPAILTHCLMCDLESEWNNMEAAERHPRAYLDVARRNRGDWMIIIDGLKALAVLESMQRAVESDGRMRCLLEILVLKATSAFQTD